MRYAPARGARENADDDDRRQAWLNPAGGHMGRSADWPDNAIFEQVVVPWLARQLTPAP